MGKEGKVLKDHANFSLVGREVGGGGAHDLVSKEDFS